LIWQKCQARLFIAKLSSESLGGPHASFLLSANRATDGVEKSDILLTHGSAFKIQLRAMLIDSSLNSVATVLANLHQSFYEAAVRCLEYSRVLSKVRRMCSSLLISTCILFLCLQLRELNSIPNRHAMGAVCRNPCAGWKSQPEQMCGRSSLLGQPALATKAADLIAETVENIVALAYVMLQRRSRSCRSRGMVTAQSVISHRQLQW
jgi:hypothetical protein